MVKFILTKELGRLCKWLRILGFDSVYFNSDNMATLVIEALRENRIIITRRKKVDNLKVVTVSSNEVKSQLKEVIRKLEIEQIDQRRMFSRCVICNEVLVEVEKQAIKSEVPEYVYQTQDKFFRCPSCKRIYWEGTHWGNVKRILKEVGLF